MYEFLKDARATVRRFAHAPGFACVAVVTLGLGIGASTAVYSIVKAVVLRPLPFHEPERLVWIGNSMPGNTLSHRTSRVDAFLGWQEQATSFEALAAFNAFFEARPYSMVGVGEPERLRGVQVSHGFLRVLGVAPLLGRDFLAEECIAEGRPAVILGHSLWQRKLGGAGNVIGQPVVLNGRAMAIVGVLPPVDLDLLFGTKVDLLLPFPLTEETARDGNTLFGIGRLREGVALGRAQEELAVVQARLARSIPDLAFQIGAAGPRVSLLDDHVRGAVRSSLVLLSGAVLCVLLIACVNLSNLLLARASARRHECAVRMAMGASRWRLARETLMESLVLAAGGAGLGVLTAHVAVVRLTGLQGTGIPLLRTASLDPPTLAIAVGLGAASALVCGVLPILQLWRRDAREVLSEAGSRGGTARGAASARRILVVSEIALASLLLVAAGLLTRSFIQVLQTDLGFQPDQLLAWRVDTARPFSSPLERNLFYDGLVERVSVVNGIDSVGLNDSLPLGATRSWTVRTRDLPDDPAGNPTVCVRFVDRHALKTMRVPLIAGRHFDGRDSAESSRVMIVGETTARALWPGRDPLGQTAQVNGPEYAVVGVVADVTHGLEQAPQPDVYLLHGQRFELSPNLQMVVRATRDASSIVPDVRAAMAEYDPLLPSNEVTLLDEVVDRAIAPRRLITSILATFTIFALLLAAIGLYGVIAYSVVQRTREIGVRMALGAQRADVLRSVLGEGLRVATVGLALGVAAALALTRSLRSQLHEVGAGDPLTYGSTAIVLVAVALLACYLPARRAASVDPTEALRSD